MSFASNTKLDALSKAYQDFCSLIKGFFPEDVVEEQTLISYLNKIKGVYEVYESFNQELPDELIELKVKISTQISELRQLRADKEAAELKAVFEHIESLGIENIEITTPEELNIYDKPIIKLGFKSLDSKDRGRDDGIESMRFFKDLGGYDRDHLVSWIESKEPVKCIMLENIDNPSGKDFFRCECGAIYSNTFHCDTTPDNRLCFDCRFWTRLMNTTSRKAIVGGEHHIIADENSKGSFRGFGGHQFILQDLSTKEVIKTTNLWYQGIIPLRFRDRMPDTHIFLER